MAKITEIIDDEGSVELQEGQEPEEDVEEGQDEALQPEEDEEEPSEEEAGGDEEEPAGDRSDGPTLFEDPEEEQAEEEAQNELKLLRQEVIELRAGRGQPKPKDAIPSPGEKPTLAGSDYDEDKYQKAMDDWYESKAAFEAQQRAHREEQEAIQSQFNDRLNRYNSAKATMPEDFGDAEAAVISSLDTTQQGVLMQGSDNVARIVYALGKSPGRLGKLKSIKNPIDFAFAVARMESELNMKKSGKASRPAPERRVRKASTGQGNSSDKKLESLRKRARETGDFTEVVKYKREQGKR
jgi:hypothetical protein